MNKTLTPHSVQSLNGKGTQMEHISTRQDAFQPEPLFDYVDKSYILGSQLLAKPTTVRDASFSCYLEQNSLISSIRTNHLGHKKGDSEISIFDAEKYFKGIHDQSSASTSTPSNPKQSHVCSIARLSTVSSLIHSESYGMNYRAKSFRATPTSSSEASWNSQTGLLSNPPGAAAVSIRNISKTAEKNSKTARAVTKWFHGGKGCPCSGRRSTKVEESSSYETEKRRPRIARLNRSYSGGATSMYSSSRQSIPKSLPSYSPMKTPPPLNSTSLIPKEAVNNLNFTPRATFNGLKPPSGTANLDLSGYKLHKPFVPNRTTAASVKSFAAGNGATSNGFTFPILNNNNPDPLVRGLRFTGETDLPRDSLEVFQPRDNDAFAKSTGVEGGRERRSFTFPGSPKSKRASYEDDMCSEASSELFEIESFSAQTTFYPGQVSLDDPSTFNVRRIQIAAVTESAKGPAVALRRSIDDTALRLSIDDDEDATEIYAPSEVSIDWSVTTADGFDRASVTNFSVSASEFGYDYAAAAMRREAEAQAKAGKSRARNGGLSLLALTCRSDKAVSVGPKPVKHGAEDGPTSTTRVHMGNRAQAYMIGNSRPKGPMDDSR